MNSQNKEDDKKCHICGVKSDWVINFWAKGNYYVEIPLCENHRPLNIELINTKTEGIVNFAFQQARLDEIHFGKMKKVVEPNGIVNLYENLPVRVI